MEDKKKARKYLLAGSIMGGALSLSVTFLMDTFYADTFQGTWRDAIAKDLNTFFSLTVSSNSIIVIISFIGIIILMAAIGSFMGFIFSFFLYKFFSFLTK
jgi:hypothetical protein